MTQTFDEWLATRPESIQKLAKEFPLGTLIRTEMGDFHLIGYTEDDSLIVSQTDPAADYDQALASKQYICAQHLRGLQKCI